MKKIYVMKKTSEEILSKHKYDEIYNFLSLITKPNSMKKLVYFGSGGDVRG
jgi:hypothetical protein